MSQSVKKVIIQPVLKEHEGNFDFPVPVQYRIAEHYGKKSDCPTGYQAEIVVQGGVSKELKGVHETRKEARIEALEATLKLFKNAVKETEVLLAATRRIGKGGTI
jgi:hypothetical protein